MNVFINWIVTVFSRKLNSTAESLRNLCNYSELRHKAISKGLFQCSKDIDRFLSIYQVHTSLLVQLKLLTELWLLYRH